MYWNGRSLAASEDKLPADHKDSLPNVEGQGLICLGLDSPELSVAIAAECDVGCDITSRATKGANACGQKQLCTQRSFFIA